MSSFGGSYLESTPALAQAIERFNARYDYKLRLPIWPATLEAAATLAKLRGREDIAAELLACLPQEVVS